MRRTRIDETRRVGSGAALALVLVVGAAPVPAFATSAACTCASTDDSERDRADVIFQGTLDGSTSSASTDSSGEVQESGLVHQFTPTTVYKGSVTIPQYVVEPPGGDPDCALDWEGPGPYLVFAEKPSLKEKKKYQLGDADLLFRPCSGTEAIDADDEPDFGPGRPVTPAEHASSPPEPAEPTDDGGDGNDGLSVNDLVGALLDLLPGDSPDR